MAASQIPLTSQLVRQDDADFALANANDLLGTNHIYSDVVLRDAATINSPSLFKLGQTSYTQNDGKTWRLTSVSPFVWTEVANATPAEGVFFWPASKSWATLYAEILAGGGWGTIFVEPTAFPGTQSVDAGSWDFTNIRFQGIRESNTTSFGSTVKFATGALIDGGSYVALRGDAMVFSVTTALTSVPGTKRIVVELTGGSRLFRNGNNIVFDSTSATSLWSLINSSVSGAGTTLPLFNLSGAAARCNVGLLQPLSGITLPTRCFGGVLGSTVIVTADNFGGRAINTNTVQSPCVYLTPSTTQFVSNTWTTSSRPLMAAGFGLGTLGYNRDLQEYEHWNGSVWEPHVTGRVGADLASAAAISPTTRVHAVTGAAAIATINLPWVGFTGDITLLKPAGDTWSLTTGGNIAGALTPTAGFSVKLTYNGTLWYPQG